jgi:predicted NAD/FAD-dependent oxidoreductase
VFDRDAITGTREPTGLLAFVASDSAGERPTLQAAIAPGQPRAGPGRAAAADRDRTARHLRLHRRAAAPPAFIAPGLLACGDYVAGPYPATLEGAVRSGIAAAAAIAPAALG